MAKWFFHASFTSKIDGKVDITQKRLIVGSPDQFFWIPHVLAHRYAGFSIRVQPTWWSVRVDGDFMRGRLLRQRRLDQDAQRKQNARLHDSRSAARSPIHRRQRRLREVSVSVCENARPRVRPCARVRTSACESARV